MARQAGLGANRVKRRLVRPTRFELVTYSFGGCRSIHLSYGRVSDKVTPAFPGAPGRTRTCGLLVRSQSLYPAELRARKLKIILHSRPMTAESADPFGQPIGPPVPNWTARPRPPRTAGSAMPGRFCRVEPVDVERHARHLYDALADDRDGRNWTYLSYGPFDTFANFRDWLSKMAALDDPLFHAIIDVSSGTAVGVAAYMRIDPPNGVLEIGHIHYSARLQRTPAGTEAMYLMMRRAFDELGYRRYEWKCDHLNAPSRRAAERYGFTFEGIFRQATVYKGRSRDTAWFSILDADWPTRKAAFERWLRPDNFDAGGRQRRPLG
jgi:RimJ/RimL family protein N-acetyltransferase